MLRRGAGLWLAAIIPFLGAPWVHAGASTSPADEGPTFERDVLPILRAHCLACHGESGASAALDLTSREAILEGGVSGPAVVANDPEKSLLLRRILGHDGLPQMPKGFAPLSEEKVAVIRDWIRSGAQATPAGELTKHWAYVPPTMPTLPAGEGAPIDRLVLAELARHGRTFSPEASRETLVRRLSLDLTGLPPKPEDVAAFLADERPDAYERLADRLLASPHYGERMARPWLDLARFADSHGYEKDLKRQNWAWRDYVIRAYNEDKPFDQFTREQIAGDLLPQATREQIIATGFHRNTMLNQEGGTDPMEQRWLVLVDRVATTGTVWMGTSLGCAQCHDHKFDPFTMRDFYSLGAFFADLDEPILGRREDGMIVAPADQERKLAELDTALAEARKRYDAVKPRIEAAQLQWQADLVAYRVILPELQPDSKAPEEERKKARQVTDLVWKDTRSDQEQQIVRDYFLNRVNKLHHAERDAVAAAERERRDFYESLPKCLVSVSTANKRTVRLLPRGNWMDESGEVMKPALPHYLPQPRIEGRDPNRLDLARWLVSRENPLTARTVMNRIWKQFFGIGLSKVLDDLGAQGEPPVNPALLDWLACEFMDSGWDLKHMVRTVVTSATYRQVSSASPEQLAADPDNRELARQSAYRVDAELVRDTALAVSGLLVAKIGGPSVKPYQPDGYWENLNFPTRDYIPDTGESQYRRGLYTWWQRSFLHPSLLAFDAPSREECTAERNRSNLPQQSLILLNDPTYVEAARAFATRILTECRGTAEQRFAWAWQRALQRDPRSEEMQIATDLLAGHLAAYKADPGAAEQFVKVGLKPVPQGLDTTELAAWTHVARVLLNLHETITRS